MKISLFDLKRIINEELLKEVAFTPSDAINKGLALYSYADEGGLFETFVLYKAYGKEVKEEESKLRPGVRMNVTIRDSIYNTVTTTDFYDINAIVRSSIVGAIRVAKKSDKHMAYIDGVKSTERGYGPLLYDIALRYHGPIMQSPIDVSADAKRIWKGYQTKRKKDVDYTKGSPPQIALKARTSVNVTKLKETHEELPERIKQTLMSQPVTDETGALKRPTFNVKSFKDSLEKTLLEIGSEIINRLHM